MENPSENAPNHSYPDIEMAKKCEGSELSSDTKLVSGMPGEPGTISNRYS